MQYRGAPQRKAPRKAPQRGLTRAHRKPLPPEHKFGISKQFYLQNPRTKEGVLEPSFEPTVQTGKLSCPPCLIVRFLPDLTKIEGQSRLSPVVRVGLTRTPGSGLVAEGHAQNP